MTCVGHSFTVGEKDAEGSRGYRRSANVSLKKTASLQSTPELLKQASAKELVTNPQEERNWMGIGIAVLVIFIICALIVTSVLILSPGASLGRQGNRLTLDDLTSGRLYVRHFNGTWISSTELTYTDATDNVVIFNVITGNKTILITNIIYHANGVQEYWLSADRRYVLLRCHTAKDPIFGQLATYKIMDIRSQHVHYLLRSADNSIPKLQFAQWGPRGNQVIYVDRFSIFYIEEYGQRPVPLVTQTIDSVYNGVPDRSYRERILKRDNAIWWSKDGNRLCFASIDVTEMNRSSYFWYGGDADLDSPEPAAPNPVVLSYPYFKPGTPHPRVYLYIVDLQNLDFGQDKVIPPREIINSDYFLTGVVWVHENRLAITWMLRSQNHSFMSICEERKKWVCQKKLEESNAGSGWVDAFSDPLFTIDGSYYFTLLPISGGSAGNFKHLAMVPNSDARARNYLTYGSFDVTAILGYNEEYRMVYYQANSKGKPGERHVYSADDSTKTLQSVSRRVVCLTCTLDEECKYNSAVFSPGALYYVLTCGGPRIPRIEIRRASDNLLVTILDTNDHLFEYLGDNVVPHFKSITIPLLGGVEGRVKLYLPPSQNDLATTRYPLLVQVCDEPASQCVSEEFDLNWGSQIASKRNYIYMRLDGRGSAFQGDKQEHGIYRQLGISETSDFIQAVKYLKKEIPFIDNEKVAIWGKGYGGHVAASVLADDDTLFSCAFAIAPITNWRHYDAVFTERYMQSPSLDDNFVGYEMSELSRKAEYFRGKKFLVMHGTADEDVQVHHTLLLAKELVRSGVPFTQQVPVIFDWRFCTMHKSLFEHKLPRSFVPSHCTRDFRKLTCMKHFWQLYPDEDNSLSNVRHHVIKLMDSYLSQQCFKPGNRDDYGDDKHPVRTRVVKNG